MDRLIQLDVELSRLLDELAEEVERRDARNLAAPLAWLAEAHGWLRYELSRGADKREAVPFTYVALELRKS